MQHNGIISGGGVYTKNNRPWKVAAYIPIPGNTYNERKSLALKVEYYTKAKNYPEIAIGNIPSQSSIPKDCIPRRIFLIKTSMNIHNLKSIVLEDPDFIREYNK